MSRIGLYLASVEFLTVCTVRQEIGMPCFLGFPFQLQAAAVSWTSMQLTSADLEEHLLIKLKQQTGRLGSVQDSHHLACERYRRS